MKPRDPAWEPRVRASLKTQNLMTHFGVEIVHLEPGLVQLGMNFDERFTQQNGFLHAGVVTSVVDSACGYAAFSLMEPDADVLSVEFKVNLIAPARGLRLVAEGRVLKSGRTLSVCVGEARMLDDEGESRLVAQMQATMISIRRTLLAWESCLWSK